MTDKRPTPDTSAGKGRRKRAAPTIDLTATDVTTGDVPQAVTPDPPPHEILGEPPPQAAAPPEPEPAAPPHLHEAKDQQRKSLTATLTMPVLAAGVAGAAAMSLILLGLWLTGMLPAGDTGSDALRAQIAGLETQVQDLQKRPAPVADTKPVEALTQRVARMEDSIKNMPAGTAGDPALAGRVTAADNALKSLGLALTALNRRNDELAANSTQARERAEAAEKAVVALRASVQDVSKAASAGASSADLEPLQQRIATLEQSARTATAEIAKTSASDNAARLALSAAALRDAVARGAPFSAELAQAKSLGADEKILAPLSSYAAGGVPSEKALAAELSALLPRMIKSAGAPPASGGFIERLQANAGQLVKIRPVDAPVGDDPTTVLARLEVDAAKADIAAALTDLGKLTDAQRAPAQGWIAEAQSRQAALAAVRQFAADTARSLGTK
ncbi:MAG: hypothetical protein Q8M24_13035 [Pseudolabrys sp.]|nr:hypothetical protein [Pseudolabrys sp.]MDP2296367.1 hypothetical protein [Pseudolabrys sp.]